MRRKKKNYTILRLASLIKYKDKNLLSKFQVFNHKLLIYATVEILLIFSDWDREVF